MLVKELIAELQKLPQDDPIVVTGMDDYFSCDDFVVQSYDDAFDEGYAWELILPYYFERYVKDGEEEVTDLTGVYTEEDY